MNVSRSVTDQRRRDLRQKGRRFDALDGIRTLAVLAVMLYHVIPAAIRGGGAGVDVFFTLSGFVITRLLLKEYQLTGRIRLGTFYALRISRLWPALMAVSFIVAGLALLLPATFWGGEQYNALRSSLHVMNFYRGGWFGDSTDGGSLGHTWSLAVEEHFYLVWPLLFILLLKFVRRMRVIALVTAGACLLVVLERGALQVFGAGYERIYNGPDTRADQLLIGCLLAMTLSTTEGDGPAVDRISKMSRAAIWPCAAAVVVALIGLSYPHGADAASSLYRTCFPLVIALATAGLIGGLVLNSDHRLSRLLSTKWLSWAGKHMSYGMYLWHYPIFFLLRGLYDGPGSAVVRMALGVILTVVVAYVSARYLEEPIRKAVKTRTTARELLRTTV